MSAQESRVSPEILPRRKHEGDIVAERTSVFIGHVEGQLAQLIREHEMHICNVLAGAQRNGAVRNVCALMQDGPEVPPRHPGGPNLTCCIGFIAFLRLP